MSVHAPAGVPRRHVVALTLSALADLLHAHGRPTVSVAGPGTEQP
jgi:hypothetical protein